VPAEHFHMLSLIGVHPNQQHHGLGHILLSAIESVVFEDPISQGVAMFVTLPKYLSFFADGHYNLVEELEVGRIKGQLMFRPRETQ
jgi:N-acetylglutamate synthase-like GNAT family acetyltransferase